MNKRIKWSAQLAAVLLCALVLKYHYSTATPDQLRWILTPTTFLVEILTGRSFTFESYSGYMSSDHTFLIAASCAGVNFLLTAFLMLALKDLWKARWTVGWRFLPINALLAYLTTLIANTVRITLALSHQQTVRESGLLSPGQVHRVEGIVVYFGFLTLLFWLTERKEASTSADWMKRAPFPLLIYYAITLGMPLANGAYRRGYGFWQHELFVVVLPLIITIPFILVRVFGSPHKVGNKTVKSASDKGEIAEFLKT